MKRRDFLSHAAAGGTILTMPAFMQGCGIKPAELLHEESRPDNFFLSSFGVDEVSVARVMSSLTANGADIADLYFESSRSNRLVYENGAISDAKSDMRNGVGLRVINGEHIGFVTSEDLTLPAMLAAAKSAAGTDTGSNLESNPAFNARDAGDLYTTVVPWSDTTIERKTRVLRSIDEKVRAADSSVESVTVRWEDSEEDVMIATLDGDLVTDRRPLTRISLVVTAAKDDGRQTGFATIAARQDIGWYDEERIDALVAEAVERTLVQFDVRRAPQGDMPVILAAGTGGVLLHEAIGHSLEADLNRNGSSAYAGKIGEKVAESFVNVVDDARLPGEPGALNVDDEGSATGRTTMVENGVLRSYVHDRVSARHYGISPTGSGRRESYRHQPMPRLSCTFIEDGPHSREEIIAAAGDGVICETFTGGQAQLGSGDFSFDVKNGWRVEKGRITGPIKDFQIAGNGPELLAKITMVGNDTRMDAGGWTCGKSGQNVPVSQGMPTVLVSSLAVGN